MWLLMLAMMGAPATGVMGYWQGPTQTIVKIEPCGMAVCVKIVKLSANAPATIDTHNPDTSLRGRALCGVDIGSGFRQSYDYKLEDGTLYDPTTGKTYKGTIASDGDVLKLRGYVGISVFGKSQTWTRVAAVEPCK